MRQANRSESENVQVLRSRPSTYLFRAAVSHIKAFTSSLTPLNAAEKLYGRDLATEVVIRAATQPAALNTPGWAGALGRQVVSDLVASIASLSAAADLIGRGRTFDLTGLAQLSVPGRVLNAAAAGQWVAEGGAKPVRALNFNAGAVLVPRKLAVIVAFTEEMTNSSNIEAAVRALLGEASGLALDAAMFSANPDDGAHPAGILYNVAPIVAATGGGLSAMTTDLGKLVDALAANGGGKTMVLVANPAQAMTLSLLAGPHFTTPVLASASVPAGSVIAVESSSFCSGFDSAPEFDVSDVGTAHFEDTSPTGITGGTPSPAVPVRSTWQTRSIALKMTVHASWGVRAAGHVAWVQNTTW
jgi:hypothetical protein